MRNTHSNERGMVWWMSCQLEYETLWCQHKEEHEKFMLLKKVIEWREKIWEGDVLYYYAVYNINFIFSPGAKVTVATIIKSRRWS